MSHREAPGTLAGSMPNVTRIPLGYNNVYAVTAGSETVLVDTGPDFRGAAAAVGEALGGAVPGLVVATHAHMDHASLGSWWQGQGVPVAMGAADAAYASDPARHTSTELDRLEQYARGCGAPAAVVAGAIGALARRRRWAAVIADVHAGYPPESQPPRWPSGLRYEAYTPASQLNGDAALGAGLRAIACPGHTPGNLVVVAEEEGWLFSGDQVLPGMTPTPALQLAPAGASVWRYRSLPAFRASLTALRGMQLRRCFPGHGEPFDGVDEAIAANLAAIGERGERLLRTLRVSGPATVYSLADRLYPRALGRRFWQIMSTVQGHLDVLESDEAVAVLEAGARYAARR